jgi:outer membrane protein assembly factor BamB
MHTRCLLFLPLPLLLAAALAPAGDWPRFRGPQGAGTSADKGVPVKWTDKDVLFKARLPGVGHSSPIVVGNRVLLLSATPTERLVLCYDAGTGKELWRRAVPGGVGKTHRKSSLASATPCSDGERVYCAFWDGESIGLFAYDLAGKALWKRDLGRFTSQHGAGFSPIVHGGKVIVNNDQDGSAALLAFDAKTGKPAWEVERKAFRACYSTPFVLGQGTSEQLIVTSTAGVTGYDPADGKELWSYHWSFPGMPLRTVGSSVAADGMVFACAGDGSGDRAMIAVKLGGKGDVTGTHLAWSKDSGTPYVPTLVAHEGHLYGVLDNGNAVCFETKSGKRAWQERMAATVSASPVLIDGKVYVFDEKGDAWVFAASPAGLKVLARNRMGEPVVSSPAVANGRLYVRGGRHLICLGKKGGE